MLFYKEKNKMASCNIKAYNAIITIRTQQLVTKLCHNIRQSLTEYIT